MSHLRPLFSILAGLTLGAILLEVLAYKFVFKRPYGWRSALASLSVSLGRGFTRFLPLAIIFPGAYWLFVFFIL